MTFEVLALVVEQFFLHVY